MNSLSECEQKVRELRALGMSDETISMRLSIEGWPGENIAGALCIPKYEEDSTEWKITKSEHPAEVHQTALVKPPLPIAAQRPVRASAKKRALPALVGVALVAMGAAGYALYTPNPVYSISIPSANAATTTIEYGALAALADPDFYSNVRNGFLEKKASFITADLDAMKLVVYKNGERALEVPILAKGKVGSWWETPVGIYKVETKERSHFSSFGEVTMPYSMQFQGNFFVHGWPEYEDGTPVSSSYSGGCIRLSTPDSEKIFALAEVGMPILVYGKVDTRDGVTYSAKGPATLAKEYLVADMKNGAVLVSKDSDTSLPIASVTKLMTALIVVEHFNLDKRITITQGMITKTTVQRLRVGQSISVHDLLIVMLTESSNEAAETFAQYYGRERFIVEMNKKAGSIGLTTAHFADASGLSLENTASPEDLFTLVKYIHDNRRFIFDITSDSLKNDAYGEVVWGNLGNFNFIPGIPSGFIGGKIGKTNEARETYAGVFSYRFENMERPIAIIVLGSNDVQKDVAVLYTYVKNTFIANE